MPQLRVLTVLTSALALLPAQSFAQSEVYYSGWQQGLADAGPWLMPLLLIIMPLLGFGFLGVMIVWAIQKLSLVKKNNDDKSRQDDFAMQRHERLVLASALAGELTENKIKCEAFITIYSELLRNLRETDRKAMYEDTGDFIHQYPPLSRKAFENNIEKIGLLGMKLATDITTAYAPIRGESEYFTLDAGMPRANAVRMVEMILDDAQRTLEPLEGTISALNMIVRDGSAKSSGGGK